MKLMSDDDKHILRKFIHGSYISCKEEGDILKRYATIDYVIFGFDYDNMRETAILTDLDKKHLNIS